MADLALATVGAVAPAVVHGVQSLFGSGGKAERTGDAEPVLVLYAGIWGWLYNGQVLEQYRIEAEVYHRQMREHTIRVGIVSVVFIVCQVCQVIVSLRILTGYHSQLERLAVVAAQSCITYLVPRGMFALFDLNSTR